MDQNNNDSNTQGRMNDSHINQKHIGPLQLVTQQDKFLTK